MQPSEEISFLRRILISKCSNRCFDAWSILTIIFIPLFYYQAFIILNYPFTIEMILFIPILAPFAGISLILIFIPTTLIVFAFVKCGESSGRCDGCGCD